MSTEVKPPLDFGPFHLDPQDRLLLREGEPVSLTPKAFDALLFLVENRGRLVLKQDLMKALWPDTFVNESNLTQTVFMLRKALGNGDGPRYIVTVAGHGYRFVAEVRQTQTPEDFSKLIQPEPVPVPPIDQDSQSQTSPPSTVHRESRPYGHSLRSSLLLLLSQVWRHGPGSISVPRLPRER
jgi:DNA-binding winged helix-turn-helix (wHTH) protein